MKHALLVIDVQQVMCSGAYAAFDVDAMIDRINQVSARARAAGAPVFFIQHEDGYMQYGSAVWQLSDRLAIAPEDVRVRKTAPDSFLRTDLEALLRARGVEKLVICGLQSEFCVDSTVRGALARGFPVVLVGDGHSTLDNGVLSAAQITAHHNKTLASTESFGPRVSVVPAADVRIGA